MIRAFSGSHRRQRGFSIIELMISIVIGMIAIVFATRMITGSEKGKQTALSSSDAMQNGMLAMFSMSNDVSQAGFGLNDPLLVGCDTNFTDTGSYTMAPATRGVSTIIHPLAAVIIESGGTNPDVVTMYAGGALSGTATVRLVDNYTGGTSMVIDREPFAFAAGDVIVAAPEQPGVKCSLAQLSEAPAVAATVKMLRFNTGSTLRFNTGALGASYAGGSARIFNLGPAAKLSFHTWSVANGYLKLRATDMSGAGGTPAPVADNIVSIKALYGFDTRTGTAFKPEESTNINRWSATMIDADSDGVVGGAGDYQHVVAVRLAVVARSKAPERPAAGGSCDATVEATRPKVFQSAQPQGTTAVPITVNVVVTGDTVDWKCYRYRVFETIVPLRNAGWRPTAWTK